MPTETPWFLLEYIPLPITRAVYRDAPSENDGYQITRFELSEIRKHGLAQIAEIARLNAALTAARTERDALAATADRRILVPHHHE